ncbi:MAG: hypothetical protein Q9177_000762, partial [Variospora cf. flavescens]
MFISTFTTFSSPPAPPHPFPTLTSLFFLSSPSQVNPTLPPKSLSSQNSLTQSSRNTGYNHTLSSILPHLEPTSAGPSTQWAVRTARRLGCLVCVGYPEISSPNPPSPGSLRPTMIDLGPGSAEKHYQVTAYNSVVAVNARGEVVAHYRKTNLYYTDERWAQEAPEGFTAHDLAVADGSGSSSVRTT